MGRQSLILFAMKVLAIISVPTRILAITTAPMEDENTSLITKNLKLCLSDSSSPSWLRKPKSAKTSVLSLFPALLLCLWTPRHDWQISHEGSYGTCPLSLWATSSSAVKAFKWPPPMFSGSSSGILYSFSSYGLTLIQGVSYQTERPCATDFVSRCIILTVFPHEKSQPCFPSLQTESIGYQEHLTKPIYVDRSSIGSL